MLRSQILIGFTVVALGATIVAPGAKAFPPCGRTACGDEVAASGLTGTQRSACFKQVIADCKAGACSCTGGSPPCSCVCGDGLCGPSENCSTCPQDCDPCAATTTTTTTTTSSCPPATGFYCGGVGCGPGGAPGCFPEGICPQGMTCDQTTCLCTGATILCDDPKLGGATCNFCKYGTCPAGMTCGGVPKSSGCGYDCACH